MKISYIETEKSTIIKSLHKWKKEPNLSAILQKNVSIWLKKEYKTKHDRVRTVGQWEFCKLCQYQIEDILK